MNKKLLRLFLCLTLVTVFATLGLAADKTRPSGVTTTVTRQARPQVDPFAGVKKLFSNLGPDPTDLYDASNGWLVAGHFNVYNGQKQDVAIPFRSPANASIVGVRLPLQWYGYGANQATVAIYSDAGGAPGSAIAHKDLKNFDSFGSGCCNLASWKLATPVPVTKGTTYWVVATTNNASKDSVSVWDLIYNDAPGIWAYQQDDGGWIVTTASDGYALPAVAVYGQ
ncbi:MAG TPA: choice-of-anchor R domain-containing protein [Terriglobales bacterium]